MSIQLFHSHRRDLSLTSFPRNHLGTQAWETIAAANRVLVWLRFCPRLRQKRSTKSHEAARTKPVLLRVISWIVLPGERQSLEIEHYPTAQSKARFGRH